MLELLKMAHFIAVAMATGLVLAHYIMLRASARREDEPGMALALRTAASVTSFVVVLIWISGLTLLWSRYGSGDREPSVWFFVKIGFVILFTAAHVLTRITAGRGSSAGDPVAARRRIERFVSLTWLAALLAICLAVISFG
jgi:hypothetical protein